MLIRRLLVLAMCACACECACVQDLDRDLQDDVSIVATREAAFAEPVIARLAGRGPRAIPAIETALHTAKPTGRVQLVITLRRIGDGEAIPLLRHLARWDDDEAVRKEADFTLHTWAGGSDARGAAARAALAAAAP